MPEPYRVQSLTSQVFRLRLGGWCDQVAYAHGRLVLQIERYRRFGREVYVISAEDWEILQAVKSDSSADATRGR